MDPRSEIKVDYAPLFRIYNNGRIDRFTGNTKTPAGFDPVTNVTSKDVTVDSTTGVSARLYLPTFLKTRRLPILVYYHGGVFCVESASSPPYHFFLNLLVSRANIVAVSVDYRLAPEHLIPAAYDDSWAALKWALGSGSDAWLRDYGDFERVFLAGDSAGGNITHNMAMRAGAEGIALEGIQLVHPFFWGTERIGSETMLKAGTVKFIANLWTAVTTPDVGPDDPRFNPIAKSSPSLKGLGCRRAMVCVADCDRLAERGRAYCEVLRGSGWKGEVELVESKGEHVFHLKSPEGEEALALLKKMVEFFTRGRGQDFKSNL
ncbi:uncharacterized protein A4U43_UnF9900 [Asparagus officinalis]|uniref:Alpha/beta hydrolase fold-3 domain-containing protein n=1 Tax=Asparagus officinalis TaxID=4686 RepID=A0A1R3L5K6_ASPOF|nr:tuliposide A-converting enzyme 1, chloroplastic-like [Asparagus officinalis]ONK54902.1 uncharacterized protein A4U43_UnF9900 [Asparagus officinalis]